MLHWNVYIENANRDKIEVYDIFQFRCLEEDLKQIKREYKDNKKEFEERVRSQLMYHFWSKCEWETVLTALINPKDKTIEKKIDVFNQIELNWKVFIDYVWENL